MPRPRYCAAAVPAGGADADPTLTDRGSADPTLTDRGSADPTPTDRGSADLVAVAVVVDVSGALHSATV